MTLSEMFAVGQLASFLFWVPFFFGTLAGNGDFARLGMTFFAITGFVCMIAKYVVR